MSSLKTDGFPSIALVGSSVDPKHARGTEPRGAWEILQLAISKDLPSVPAHTHNHDKQTIKWSRHACDAVRVILGLDVLYANDHKAWHHK